MQAFVGIDVSKNKLDVCVITDNLKVRKEVIKNSEAGFFEQLVYEAQPSPSHQTKN